jgi:predicted AlkP superfamily pyrophosphatase or phosphodiesterase
LIDGLRPDALEKAQTPHIDSLWRTGAYTWKAQTAALSLTLPAITSLLTGLTVEHHGIRWNSWEPDRGLVKTPTLFDAVHFAGYSTAFFAGKKKLAHLNRPTGVDYFEIPGNEDREVMQKTIAYIESHRPQLVFIHLPSVDAVGHSTSWMSKQQLQAVEKADAEIGSFLQLLKRLAIQDQSLVLLTSDHGGRGKFHGSDDARDRTIPWILWGVGIKQNHEISETVYLWDSATTILYALGLSQADLDGQILAEVFLP